MSAGKEINNGRGVARWPTKVDRNIHSNTREVENTAKTPREVDTIIANSNFPKESVKKVDKTNPTLASKEINPPSIFYVHIGRNQKTADGGIPTKDLKTSRDHCKLLMIDGEISGVCDKTSQNGTSVNGQKIPGAAELTIGDTIKLGETIINITGSNKLDLYEGNDPIPKVFTIDPFGEIEQIVG